MNLGIGLGVTNFLRVPAVPLDPDAAIAALFSSGEEGAWYDPSDSTTVFQDSTGTTAAGVGDPVGLILDKSKGLTLGPELVTNGTFDTDLTGWSTGPGLVSSLINGAAAISRGPGTLVATDAFRQNIAVTANKTYKITFTASNADAARNFTDTSPALSSASVGQGSFTYIVKALSSTISLNFWPNPNETVHIDNVSVRELPGNHATQTTSAARPVLQQSGDLYYLDFDGVDDKLETASVVTIPTSPDLTASIAFRQNTVPTTHHTILSFGGFVSNGAILQTSSPGSPYRYRLARNGSTFSDSPTDNVAGTDYIWTFENSSSGASVRRNQVTKITSATVTDIASHYWTVGSRTDSTQYCDAHVYAIVGVNRTLTSSETLGLESYLANKSGVTL